MTCNYGQTSYPYPYPNSSSMDMQSYYYPSTMSMNYMPYYPTSSSPMYTSGQQMCYQPNGSYTGNSTTSYGYSAPQSSSNRRL
jgi:long-subunit fatty acid transport protein